MIVAIIVIVCIVIIAIMVGVTVMVVAKPDVLAKKGDPKYKNEGKTGGFTEVGNTKDFVPVTDIDYNIMEIGHHMYRMIIECSSINYDLLSDIEQETESILYNRFLNSLSFPVAIYVQSTEIANTVRVREMEKKIQSSIERFPQIAEYASEFIKASEQELPEVLDTTKIKKKYVIVPYDESELKKMDELNTQELVTFMKEELRSRCGIVASGLIDCGLNVKILNKQEITEVLYAYYHRDMYLVARDIASGYYDSLTVEATRSCGSSNTIISILEKAKNDITGSLMKHSSDDSELAFYKYFCDCLDMLILDAQETDNGNSNTGNNNGAESGDFTQTTEGDTVEDDTTEKDIAEDDILENDILEDDTPTDILVSTGRGNYNA